MSPESSPFHEVFAAWYAEAQAHEPRVPDAMQVATVDSSGRPSLRTVLCKAHGPDGFVFYTNLDSQKGVELAGDARVSLLFPLEVARAPGDRAGPG